MNQTNRFVVAETFGVKALAERIAGEFSLEWSFLDFPTGL